MEEGFVVYDRMLYPDEQFVCCIGGRVLCAVRYLLGKPGNMDLFSYLRQCRIDYHVLIREHTEDPWFYQPLEIITELGNPVFSREGIRELDGFLKRIGIRLERVEFPGNTDLWNAIKSAFAHTEVLVLNIDQYYHPKSEKFHRQKYAWHALLLKGFCERTGEVLVSDSTHGKEYPLAFEVVQQMCIGSGYLVKRDTAFAGTYPEQNPILFDWDRNFLQPVFCFLKEMREKFSGFADEKELAFYSYGYCYTIKYTIIPFVKMALQTEQDQQSWNIKLLLWEKLSRLLVKMALSGKDLSKRIDQVIQDLVEEP